MEESQKQPSEAAETSALDVEFLPITLLHKVHRNLRSSQVEVVAVPYYYRETTPEPEAETLGEADIEGPLQEVVYAPPLPALRERKNWWDFSKPVYAFNNPRIRARIELLMTSRIVHVTDRKYMVRLQEKIKEDYAACLRRRIQERAAEEIEREKNLLLDGKIRFEDAPLELQNHPVCRINQLAQKIIRHKKAKIKIPDKTWGYKTSVRRIRMMERVMRDTISEMDADRCADRTQVLQSVCMVDEEPNEDIKKGLMFTQEDYQKLKLEDPLIKLLREIDAVNEMYELADQIVGTEKVELNCSK